VKEASSVHPLNLLFLMLENIGPGLRISQIWNQRFRKSAEDLDGTDGLSGQEVQPTLALGAVN
jgi:hypothetical protein